MPEEQVKEKRGRSWRSFVSRKGLERLALQPPGWKDGSGLEGPLGKQPQPDLQEREGQEGKPRLRGLLTLGV